MKRFLLITGIALMTLFMVTVAQAVVTMPGPGQDGSAFLHLGDPPNSTKLWNGEVTALTSNKVSILDVDGPTLLDPIWLILGIPDVDASYVAPTIASLSITNGSISLLGGPVYKDSLNSGETLYNDIFGIQGDNSQSFTNWNLWQNQINGFTAGSYGIFVYEFDLSGGAMVGKDQIDVLFNSYLKNGTYAVAIGQYTAQNGNTRYATTPFTETGLMIPEPSMLLLFGSGILALGFFGRKK